MNPSFTSSISIVAAPARVMWAFFNPVALAAWWQTSRSVTVPRVLGAYAVEWEPTEFSDEMLGRLGGTFHGTVMEYKPDREFFVAEAFWLPPDGNPIGPMALEVRCEPQRAEESAGHAREGHAACVGGWRSLETLLRRDCARLGARAAVSQAVPRNRQVSRRHSNFCRLTEFCSARSSRAFPLMKTTVDPRGTRPRAPSSCFNNVPVVSASFAMPVVIGVTPR